MTELLVRFDPFTNFDGMTVKEPQPRYGYTVRCATCDGYGGYVRQIDRGRHDQGFCNPCNGWGWRDPASLCFLDPVRGVHAWGRGTTVGNCLTRYDCACGESQEVDSSG